MSQNGWRWMVGLGAVPALLQAVLLLLLPESPRWLVRMERNEQARVVLQRVYGRESRSTADCVLRAIGEEVAEEGESAGTRRHRMAHMKTTWGWLARIRNAQNELFGISGNRRALTIACMLQGLQQLCGFVSFLI